MNVPPQTVRAVKADEPSEHPLRVVDSTTLLAGRRELIIRHGEDAYRLRLTASNKLILTK